MELLLYAGIVMAAGVAVLAMGAVVAGKGKVEGLAEDTAALVANLEDAIGTRQSYHGLTNALVISQNLAPEDLNQGGVLSTPFGLLDVSSYGARHDGIRLTFHAIPAKHCPDMVSALAPLAHEMRVGQVVVVNRGRVSIESLGACENGDAIELDRWTVGKGLKATWESW